MTLWEFLQHIKHKSIELKIYDLYEEKGNNFLYIGTIGEYLTSVKASELNSWSICKVYPWIFKTIHGFTIELVRPVKEGE